MGLKMHGKGNGSMIERTYNYTQQMNHPKLIEGFLKSTDCHWLRYAPMIEIYLLILAHMMVK